MPRKLDEVEFTIFDTETTGLEPESGDRIVEIGAIRFQGERRLASFQSLVNPGRPISLAAFAVNHISQDMLCGAPAIETLLPRFLEFVRGSCLCSYNAGFDLGFLNNEMKIAGMALPDDLAVVDILGMSRRLIPGLPRYALWFVAQRLGIKAPQEHRALADVQMTFAVFNHLKGILALKGIFDFEIFYGLFGVNKIINQGLDNQKLARIQEAIQLGVKLKIKYLASGNAAVSERQVVPKQLREENKRMYLVAHCCLRNQERTFRVDGILQLEIV
jgi:DNA polymerase III epsilon subunit family exonuclease